MERLMSKRDYSETDELIIRFDNILSAVFPAPGLARRRNPAGAAEEPAREAALEEPERRRAAGLMRVNHAGEVAAQALYSGQALVARDARTRAALTQAAIEESDHLRWCEERVRELDSHVSYLTPVWHLGSFAIGAAAGMAGDKWNLGFVLETERQVVAHLERHLERLPEKDQRSRRIVSQMREDEARHATTAAAAGAAELPAPVKTAMRYCSKVMTTTAYWI